MTRRILLTLADDTTETHCGSCPMAADVCMFDGPGVDVCDNMFVNVRTKTCVAAERDGHWDETLQEVERLRADIANERALREAAERAADVCHANHTGELTRLRDEREKLRARIERAKGENHRLRADLARMTAERDEERHLATVRGEMLTQVERERDARPDISAEEWDTLVDLIEHPRPAPEWLRKTIREHAKRAKVGDDA